jgi:hypothetical protein
MPVELGSWKNAVIARLTASHLEPPEPVCSTIESEMSSKM